MTNFGDGEFFFAMFSHFISSRTRTWSRCWNVDTLKPFHILWILEFRETLDQNLIACARRLRLGHLLTRLWLQLCIQIHTKICANSSSGSPPPKCCNWSDVNCYNIVVSTVFEMISVASISRVLLYVVGAIFYSTMTIKVDLFRTDCRWGHQVIGERRIWQVGNPQRSSRLRCCFHNGGSHVWSRHNC